MKCQIAFNKLRPGGECEEQLEPTHVAQWAKNEKVCFFDFADKTGILAEFLEKFCYFWIYGFLEGFTIISLFWGDLSSLCPSATVQIGSVILCFMLNQTVLELINIDNHSKFA